MPGLAGAWHRNCLRLSAGKEVWLMAHDTHIYGEVKNKNDGVKIQGMVKHISLTRFSSRASFVVVACAVVMLAAYSTPIQVAAQQPESTQLDKLGTVDFPTSGS